ncbi:MAG TPA: ABC-type transport auxiliary lipoprotein family protein [Bryobacteraceae bacterium]|nr:ABC-type transport auxiliary lipoprotein family protein [Bryobacteraceae bacterium]
MRATFSCGLVAIACALALGCASTRPVHYYTLASVSVPANQVKPGGPAILVGPIETSELLQDTRILYRSGANLAGAYEYHRWTERPGTMVREGLLRALRSTGEFQKVLESASTATGDYLVRGKLYEFGEVDDPSVKTSISLQLELIDTKTKRDVWYRHFSRDEPAAGKAMKDVVESMDRNLQQVLNQAAAEIGQFAAAHR